MVANWIFQDNLEPFLTALSWIVGYRIDDDDWEALTTGLLETGGDSFEFAGVQVAKIKIAVDQGTEVLQVQVEVPEELEPQVDLAFAIFQHYHLRKHRS